MDLFKHNVSYVRRPVKVQRIGAPMPMWEKAFLFILGMLAAVVVVRLAIWSGPVPWDTIPYEREFAGGRK